MCWQAAQDLPRLRYNIYAYKEGDSSFLLHEQGIVDNDEGDSDATVGHLCFENLLLDANTAYAVAVVATVGDMGNQMELSISLSEVPGQFIVFYVTTQDGGVYIVVCYVII